MIGLFVVACWLALTMSQSDKCDYRVGGLNLDLTALKGDKLFFEGNNGFYEYTVCANDVSCSNNGILTMDMISYQPVGINECFNIGTFNETIKPYFNFAVGSFVFNYTGGKCNKPTQQELRSTLVVWNCNKLAEKPFISDVYHFDDCNDFLEVEYAGACETPPPPNLKCEFKSGLFGGKTLNLSSIQGNTLLYTDANKRQWVYSPCANKLPCTFPGKNYTAYVMSELKDTAGDCAKILAEWSGDDVPFYDRTVFGQDYWDFFWINGQECTEGGPYEVLNVRYYCNPNITTTFITSAGPAGPPCQFRIEIDSPLAC